MDLCIEDMDFNKHQILNLKGEVGFYLLKSYYCISDQILMNTRPQGPNLMYLSQAAELSTPGSNLESPI